MSETISLTSGSQNFKRRSPGPVSERKTEGNVLCLPALPSSARGQAEPFRVFPAPLDEGVRCLLPLLLRSFLGFEGAAPSLHGLQPSAYSHQSFSKLSADLPTVDLRQYNETHKAEERPTLLPHLLLVDFKRHTFWRSGI